MAVTQKSNQNIILTAMILAVSMTTIDQTIVALSADTIQSGLGISHAAMTWSVNAYLLATAAFFMLGGRLADVFGHKRMAIIGIIGFALCSLLCGLTPSGNIADTWLITARAVQGFFTALMFPAALGIVLASFSEQGRGKAMATFFGITGAVTAIGPILGGDLTEWTWRSIFFINLPIALLALVLIARQYVPETRVNAPIDWKGAATVALGMGLAVCGLQQAGTWGWNSALTWAFIVCGLAFLGIFVLLEEKVRYPLLRIGLFKSRAFSLSTIAVIFASMAFIPIFFFMSVYAQISLGLSVNQTGLLLLEFFIGFVIASRYGGQIFDKHGARIPLLAGGALGAAAFAWWATKLGELQDGGAFFSSPQFWPTVLAGAGLGLMFSAAATDIANRGGAQAYGASTGISQTAKNLGGAVGLAIFSALLATQLNANLTQSFTALGASATDASAVAQNINSGQQSSQSSGDFDKLPPPVQKEFKDAVRTSYANANKPVFYGMSATMAIVFVMGLLYPHTTAQEKAARKVGGVSLAT
ncbi:MFS transporter [Candidatus Saccharibacteria bacterium]|nr:MAG: MFS transporter [Candidatus Saccharibacteria bacterium]